MYDLPMIACGYGQVSLSSTNVYTLASAVQASFTATGSGVNLTTSSVTGFIRIGSTLAGSGVTTGTTIVSQTSGTPNGAGVYVTSVATTSSTASLTTAGIPSTANVAIMTVSTANVRWRDDGAAPTASVGVLIPAASVPYQYTGPLSAFQLTAVSGSPSVDVAFYKQ